MYTRVEIFVVGKLEKVFVDSNRDAEERRVKKQLREREFGRNVVVVVVVVVIRERLDNIFTRISCRTT